MSSQPTLQSIRDREFTYLLSNTRLRVKQKTPRMDIGSVHLEAMNEGDAIDLPRWIAEVLIRQGICESQEESFASEVFKAVTREKIAGPEQIPQLKQDFYLKIRRHLTFESNSNASTNPEIDKTRTLIYDLIALRLRKILSVASSLSPTTDIKDKLTPEEYQIFDTVYTLLQSWRSMTMDGK